MIAMLDFMQSEGMVRGHWTDFFTVVSSLEEIADLLKQETV